MVPPKFPVATFAGFGVGGKTVDPDEITRLLHISPSYFFRFGEQYEGREKVGDEIRKVPRLRPTSVWHIDSRATLNSEEIEDHVAFLLSQIEPAAAEIKNLIADSTVQVQITIWQCGDFGFGLPSDTWRRLAELSKTITVTLWTEEELRNLVRIDAGKEKVSGQEKGTGPFN